MKKYRIAYAAWLLLAACLYFFENNTGTRVVLLSSVLFPLIPPLRAALFMPDGPGADPSAPDTLHVKQFFFRDPEEPDDVRQYVPGDPLGRVHWKLSAKRDELLVRSTPPDREITEEELPLPSAGNRPGRKRSGYAAAALSAGILACLILLLAVPEASRGARELCNRLFSASEAVNSYVYRRFVVPENQSVLLASVLLLCAAFLLLALTVILRSRPAAFGIMAACVLFQVYFGLPFPAWVNILLCALSSLWMLRRPPGPKALAACCALFLLVSLLVVLFLPGVDAATESASETVRDYLTRLAEQLTGSVSETPGGETETRRIHTRSLDEGDRAAETMQEFRLLSVEEEQVSMPRWIDWMKTVLLFLLAIVLVTLPFAPFLLLNAGKKKARKMREPFASGNVNEAVQAVFRSIILWLEATDHGAGNLLYRDWSTRLPDDLLKSSADYSARFSRCAADYEEAVYSDHPLPEQKRRDALDLLRETEAVLWKAADRKTRFRLKYRLCLVE